MTDPDEKSRRHRERMRRKKKVIDDGIARATERRGIVIVLTGNGKGKSSSGFGMVARALGHDMRIAVVQFIKGAYATGEEAFFQRFPENVDFNVMGDGFTWDTQDRDKDIATVRRAWNKALSFLGDSDVDLVLLDELNIVLQLGYLPTEEVLKALETRPPMQHVVITGRGAPDPLIEAADTVTEMRDIKHAYRQGVMAQKGVEL
ncbi:MAG TPA: cob(I)yrinic acid a,c-diamide adenosyltransferase [Gammaproteobacteria bacterium]|nr:cob(I)yrinic acid a,c-diamide adenosyltransferase [Gammaproteobacteria bacterium]